jgi:hypothetical protein
VLEWRQRWLGYMVRALRKAWLIECHIANTCCTQPRLGIELGVSTSANSMLTNTTGP